MSDSAFQPERSEFEGLREPRRRGREVAGADEGADPVGSSGRLGERLTGAVFHVEREIGLAQGRVLFHVERLRWPRGRVEVGKWFHVKRCFGPRRLARTFHVEQLQTIGRKKRCGKSFHVKRQGGLIRPGASFHVKPMGACGLFLNPKRESGPGSSLTLRVGNEEAGSSLTPSVGNDGQWPRCWAVRDLLFPSIRVIRFHVERIGRW